MPRDLNDRILNAMMAETTAEMVLWLLIIEHDDLVEPLRIVNNSEDVMHDGEVYTAMGFEVIPPEDREGTPRSARVTFDNVSQWLTPTIRNLNGDFDVTFKRVMYTDLDASPPEFDEVLSEFPPMKLSSVSYDVFTVRGVLSYDDVSNSGFPKDEINRFTFGGLY